ncbi:MAG: CocE/NonD family hydrolase [Verrucomicrobiota bacterium]
MIAEANGEPTVVENVWIRMSDGASLAARLWLPPEAEQFPVPAILEYIPYRKGDHKSIRDEENHGYFASHGYAGVRVDLRGSGDSDGILRGEYLQQELDDGLEVLRWIAAQPWCCGRVGLFGLSWGGFNGLQLAALQPPELGAVISVCSSDDRYADDVHYMGGCLLTDNLSWASTMFAFNSCPPDPRVVGERWREMWLERLEGSDLWIKDWLEHPRRDSFWTHGSVCEDYGAIQVPVMAVSGWADGYTNAVFRLLENLDVPRRGLVGPWGHKYPHKGGPGPDIDFLGECLRWWDHWLKRTPTGLEQEPMLTAWMQDSSNPLLPASPGRWIAEPEWPAPSIQQRTLRMGPRSLSFAESAEPEETMTGESDELTIQSPLSVGLFAGKWCSYAESTDLPWDQRAEDGGSLTFDTAALATDLEILGRAEVCLELSADKPVAMVAVRLCDVAPNDRATRVTFGVLNLSHRNGHEKPEELVPGQRYQVRVPLNNVAQRFPSGHRIRLSVSSSYWPLAWPSPEAARLTLYLGGCRLTLPERVTPSGGEPAVRDMGERRAAPSPPATLLAPADRQWNVNHNLATNEVSLNVVNNDARIRLEGAELVIGRTVSERYSYRNDRYDTLRAEVIQERLFERDDWHIRTLTRTVLTAAQTHFLIRATLDAYQGDVRIYSRSWDESVARDHVQNS